jgi:hypothetical protein
MADYANGKEELKRNAPKPPAAKPPKALPKAPASNPNQGKVPAYLTKFKEEAKQKEEDNKGPILLPGQPRGTKLMPESERLQTLKDLEDNKKHVNELLVKMPISMATQSLHR